MSNDNEEENLLLLTTGLVLGSVAVRILPEGHIRPIIEDGRYTNKLRLEYHGLGTYIITVEKEKDSSTASPSEELPDLSVSGEGVEQGEGSAKPPGAQ